MQERINKHKPTIKKEETNHSKIGEQSCFTVENSKFLSNSQNKPFIRKPLSKRQTFVSPTYVKTQPIENAESNCPFGQLKSKRSVPLDSQSDKDYSELQQMSQSKPNFAIKRHISNQQNLKLSQSHFDNSQAIKQAYYGSDMYALTQIGQNYKVQSLESSQNSQKALYFSGQNMKKKIKQNIALTHLNTNAKKTTRTEYFSNKNDEVRSVSSRSLKSKEINFSQLKLSANNSIDVYIRSLEQSIRKLEKSTDTLNKKCKWMHEQVEMHLQKENSMAKQIQQLTNQLINKQTLIQSLKKQLEHVKIELIDIKSLPQLQKKQSPIKYKSFKDLQTISSLKQLSSKHFQYSKVQNKKFNETDDGYFANTSLSTQKNKKFSFKTYPGVKSPRNRKEDLSKCSSIIGNSESSYNELGETSILEDKSCLRQQISVEKSEMLCKELQKERDSLKSSFESSKLQIDMLKQQITKMSQENVRKLQQNTQHYENKLAIMTSQLECHQRQKKQIGQNIKSLEIDLDRILTAHQSQVETLHFKIKELESQFEVNHNIKSKSPKHSKNMKDFQIINPMQYLLEHPQQSLSTDDQNNEHQFQQENKSLRKYIQQMLQHYKYIKIENRMLLKLKQDLQKCQKQKKQIKEERDNFKKKLLDTLKNKHSSKKIQSESDEEDDEQSQSQSSAVFQLSQSSISYHQDSQIANQ